MVGDAVRRLASPCGQRRDAEGAGVFDHIGTEHLLCTKGEMCAEDSFAKTVVLQTASPKNHVRTKNHVCTQNHVRATDHVRTKNHVCTQTISTVLPSGHDVRP